MQVRGGGVIREPYGHHVSRRFLACNVRPALRVVCMLCAVIPAEVAAGQNSQASSEALSAKPPEVSQAEPLLPWGQASAADPGSGGLPEQRDVSWKLLVPNLFRDQKNIWLFPAHVAEGKHWKPALGFVAATAGLVALDPSEAPYFRSTSTYRTFNQVFSSNNTGIGMAAVPATFYAVSLIRHNAYDQHSSLLAGEAVLDSELLSDLMKSTVRRLRPVEVPPAAGFSDTFTDAEGGLFNGQGSFPSGHAIAAFSIATVFANRYSRHRWVPWVAYGLAAAIGFSRVTLQAHFTSDVFAGAVLGYSISRYVVLQH
jgi:membrane-associated phospholipid phosphatase